MTNDERNKFEEIKRGLVIECHDDYVGLWAVIWPLERAYPDKSDDEIREITLEMVEELLSSENIRPSDEGYYKEGKFSPWQLSTDETIARIRDEWKRLGRKPNIGDIVWFTAWPLD